MARPRIRNNALKLCMSQPDFWKGAPGRNGLNLGTRILESDLTRLSWGGIPGRSHSKAQRLQVTSTCHLSGFCESLAQLWSSWRGTSLFNWLASMLDLGTDGWMVVKVWLRRCVCARDISSSSRLQSGLTMVSQGTEKQQEGTRFNIQTSSYGR